MKEDKFNQLQNFKLSKDQIQRLRNFTEEIGSDKSKLIRLSIDAITSLTDRQFKKMAYLANEHKFPLSLFIRNCIIKCLVEIEEDEQNPYRVKGNIMNSLLLARENDIPIQDFERCYRFTYRQSLQVPQPQSLELQEKRLETEWKMAEMETSGNIHCDWPDAKQKEEPQS